MVEDFCITFIKILFFNASTTLVFLKSNGETRNINKEQKMKIIIANIVLGMIFSLLYIKYKEKDMNIAINNIICYFSYLLLFEMIIDYDLKKAIIFNSIIISISLIGLIVSTTISFMLLKILSFDLRKETIIEYLTIGIMQLAVLYLFFKIKRFKNGFSFFRNKRKLFDLIGIAISILILCVYVVYCVHTEIKFETYVLMVIILGEILMLYWIKKSITKYYKEKMKDRTVEIQQEQIKEKDKKIDDLQTELSKVLEINHKYNHRLSAMERAVIKLGNEMQSNTEFAEEYGDILDSLSELSKEYKAEVESINKTSKLPKTNIFSIDNLLDYMRQEAEKSKIEFKLQIEFDIKEIIENKIPKNKLETLLTDHIRDAIIAIENSENKNRKIEVKFSNKEFYQVEFYDTGIEFEIETLLNLGLERTTTHKATGGTGIGFMTTFETLKECKASLEIEEFNNKEYTKAVIIGFDGKNEYRIHSYRAEEIKNKIQDNRIIID